MSAYNRGHHTFVSARGMLPRMPGARYQHSTKEGFHIAGRDRASQGSRILQVMPTTATRRPR